jgi:hypothetical protein
MPLEIRRRGGRGGLRAHVHSAYSYSKNIVLQPFPVGQCVAFTNSDGHMFCERERRSRPNHHSQRTSPGAMTVLCRNSTFPADSYQQTDPHTSWPVPFSGKTRRSSQHSWNPPATKKSQNNRSVEPSPEPVPPPPRLSPIILQPSLRRYPPVRFAVLQAAAFCMCIVSSPPQLRVQPPPKSTVLITVALKVIKFIACMKYEG